MATRSHGVSRGFLPWVPPPGSPLHRYCVGTVLFGFLRSFPKDFKFNQFWCVLWLGFLRSSWIAVPFMLGSMYYDLWSMIDDLWSMIDDLWSMIDDRWSMIYDRWSMIYKWWSLIDDLWSMIYDRWYAILEPWNPGTMEPCGSPPLGSHPLVPIPGSPPLGFQPWVPTPGSPLYRYCIDTVLFGFLRSSWIAFPRILSFINSDVFYDWDSCGHLESLSHSC